MRSVCLLDVACQRGRTQVMFSGNNSTTSSHKTRAHGARCAQVLYMKKGPIIKSKATSAPPRAGSTGIEYLFLIYLFIYVFICLFNYLSTLQKPKMSALHPFFKELNSS